MISYDMLYPVYARVCVAVLCSAMIVMLVPVVTDMLCAMRVTVIMFMPAAMFGVVLLPTASFMSMKIAVTVTMCMVMSMLLRITSLYMLTACMRVRGVILRIQARLLLSSDSHPHVRPLYAAPDSLLARHLNAVQSQSVHPLYKCRLLRLWQQLQQRSREHISRCPHAAVYIQYLHRLLLNLRIRQTFSPIYTHYSTAARQAGPIIFCHGVLDIFFTRYSLTAPDR